jgi:hypothetical protein
MVCPIHASRSDRIHQIHRGEDGALDHPIDDHIFPPYRRLRRYCRRIQLVECVNYPPPSYGLTHTEGRRCVRRLGLSHMASGEKIGKELVDCLDQLTRQWSLLHYTVLRTWLQVDLAPNAFVLRQFARHGFREYVIEFDQIIV